MNVFGAFTFGSLIKTVIPGFVWLVALWLVWQGCAALIPGIHPVPDMSQVKLQDALLATIPIAILLGLVSNIIVFMGVNDVLVRNPVSRHARCRPLIDLQEWVKKRLLEDYRDQLAIADERLAEAFIDHVDPELLILETIGVQNLAYVREQYWYHMEFQVNLLLAIATALIGLLIGLVPEAIGVNLSLRADWQLASEWAVFAAVVLGGLCWFLLRAARKNFRRHVAKMTSLMAAAICGKPTKRSGDAATAAKSSATVVSAVALGGLCWLLWRVARSEVRQNAGE
jgi:hypothetical protein